jgi:hypothetical protein
LVPTDEVSVKPAGLAEVPPVEVTESDVLPVPGDAESDPVGLGGYGPEPTDGPTPVAVCRSAAFAVNEEEEEEEDVGWPEAAANSPVLEVDLSDAISESGSIEAIPTSYYASIRASGFTRLLLRNLPGDTNLALVRRVVEAAGLTLFTEGSGGIESTTASFPWGPDWSTFDDVLTGHDQYARRAGPGGASSALLLLPGLRVVRPDCAPALMSILRRDALQRGRLSLPEVRHRFNKMAVWKYATGAERVLVCANPTAGHAVADIVCPDVEGNAEKIDVIDLMTETTYKRSPEEMRTAGLRVILFEDNVQVFLY